MLIENCCQVTFAINTPRLYLLCTTEIYSQDPYQEYGQHHPMRNILMRLDGFGLFQFDEYRRKKTYNYCLLLYFLFDVIK